jgi:hypothetical protein
MANPAILRFLTLKHSHCPAGDEGRYCCAARARGLTEEEEARGGEDEEDKGESPTSGDNNAMTRAVPRARRARRKRMHRRRNE